MRFRAGAAIGLALATLAGCGDVPVARTNCWAQAGLTLTASSKGASPDKRAPSVAAAGPDVFSCR
jgi:hypothetical protein